MAEKLAVLFPGIGYQFDRPLLHFAAEQAKQYGYEILKVAYTGFPPKIRGNTERLKESVQIAEEQTGKILADMDWNAYDSVIFISKSIGTIAAAQYAAGHHINADQIFFTPFPLTFSFPVQGEAIAFHAMEDPWMKHEEVTAAAEEAGIDMVVYPHGNHSLETGNTLLDIRLLEDIFQRTEKIYRKDHS